MIEYISYEKLHTIIYKTHDIKRINRCMTSVIHTICYKHLIDFKGYLKAVKKVFDMKYHIPIYIDETLQLIPTKAYRAYENIWINKVAIASFKKDEKSIKITFYSGRTLIIDKSMQYLKKQFQRLEEIANHSSKHFHFE